MTFKDKTDLPVGVPDPLTASDYYQSQHFAEALGQLDLELLTVVRMVHGIPAGRPRSYEEVATELGSTPEMIRGLHVSALRVLFRSDGN